MVEAECYRSGRIEIVVKRCSQGIEKTPSRLQRKAVSPLPPETIPDDRMVRKWRKVGFPYWFLGEKKKVHTGPKGKNIEIVKEARGIYAKYRIGDKTAPTLKQVSKTLAPKYNSTPSAIAAMLTDHLGFSPKKTFHRNVAAEQKSLILPDPDGLIKRGPPRIRRCKWWW